MDRYITKMYETYRRDVDRFKVLLGINLLLPKILLVGAQLLKVGC